MINRVRVPKLPARFKKPFTLVAILSSLCFLWISTYWYIAGSPASVDSSPNSVRVIDWADLAPDKDLEFTQSKIFEAKNSGDSSQSSLQSNADTSPDHALPPSINSHFEAILNKAIAQGKVTHKKSIVTALQSQAVRSDFNSLKIRLAGFIVPLEFNEQKMFTSFFLVPYYGTCIHVPPPPPNQIVYVRMPQGVEIKDIYNPFWVEGTLKFERVSRDSGMSLYSMDAIRVTRYHEPY